MQTRKEIKAYIKYYQDKLDNFKEKLEVGKWYIVYHHNGSLNVLFNLKDCKDKEANGYGFDEGVWCDYDTNWTNTDNDKLTLATDQEVGDALIKEAKKRGFKDGVKIKCLNPNIEGEYILNTQFDSLYMEDGDLWFGSEEIFMNGKWAKIIEEIPEYTMEELTEKLGHTFKIKK
jgi:hypothetical protein